MKSISKIITAILLTATCSISALADETININDVTDGDNGTGWSFAGSTLTITTGGTYTITGTGPTANRIKVNTGVTAYITLSNVDISTSACAFDMISGAKVNLTLKGVNALKSGANNAGLQVPSGAFLTITEASAGGTLTANGSGGGNTAGAGIGGGNNGSGGSITINGGTVIAYGGVGSGTYGYCGAGIGGGNGGSGGTIIINGGTVIADGSSGGMNYGNCSAGIGGGSNGAGGNITINGGAVTATGRTSGKMPGYYSSSAGIGGGHNGAGGNITINGGRVIAKVGVTFYGAEIKTVAIGGGGQNGSIGNIVINGGTVTATRVNDNANSMDIGGGNSTGSIVIRGGSINATRFTRQPVNGAGASVYRNILTLTDDGLAASDAQVTAGIIGSIACDPTNTLPPAGYGIKDVKTDAQGKVSFYLPSTSTNESIRLTADDTSYEASYKRVAGDNDQTLLPVSPELVVSGANADNPAYVKWSGDVLVFKQDGTYTVSMLPGVTTTNYSTILVNPGVTADITLDGVSIDVSGTSGVCAFDMTGATVNLTLTNSNTLKSGENKAGLQVVSGSTLEITAASTGSLMAAGGRSAGIGGGFGAGIGLDAGTIIIRGGTVTASGDRAAGIGGGDNYGKGGDVIISGGTVTAIGGAYGAAIGGGLNRNNTGSVTITGGSVKVNNHDGPPPTNGIVPVYYNILTVGDPAVDNDISVTAGSISGVDCDVTPDASAGVYGIRDVKTRDYGKVYFFLPSTDVDEWVILTAGGAEWGKSYTRNNNNSNAGSLDISAYGIKLSQTGTHTFPGDDYGYDAQTPLDITVTNTGYNATGTLTIALSGAGASAFTPSKTSIAIAVDGTDNFTVTPNTELDAGTYTATVTVSGGNGISENFDVSFKVNKATPTLADLDYPDPILPVTYDGSAHSVTVTDASATIGLGAITVKYNDNPTAPTDANTYAVTVDVEEGTNYAPATFSLGNLVIGKATPTPADLDYPDPILPVTYDGSAHSVTVTDAPATTGLGAITVKYNDNPAAPTDANTYAVTVDVEEGTNYAPATFSLGDLVINKATPTPADLDYPDPIPSVTYDGSAHSVTVTDAPATIGLGAITVKYNGDPTAPTDANTYAVTVAVEEGTNYAPATFSLGNLVINKATPTPADLDYPDPILPVTYDGSAHSVTVTDAPAAIGLGAITVKYNDNPAAPTDANTYAVTVDVEEGTNYAPATFSLGDLVIDKATPTLANLTCPDPILPVTYNGSAHSVTVTDAPATTGLGAITVKYNDNPTAPTDANTYAVTVDVEEGTNYAPATLSLGNLVINKATPTPADLTYSPALVTYNGLPQPLTLTDVKAKDGITGLGTVTAVYYNGSPTAPTVTGTYKITVDVAEGDNYLAATLLLGDYTIADATPPASAFNFDLLPVTYDGKPHPVTVAAKPGIVGLGAITAIKYNGSTDVPTTAGTYTVTIDLAAGASYTAIANLSLGSFTIDKATPTLAALDFTLGDIVCSGTPYPVPVIPAKDIEGLGAITIYYNGSTTVPVDPGEYVVTIDIAAGDNYEAVTGLSLGAFTIQEPPIPVPTHFRVLLPSAAGLTTDPPAGTYNVNRGSNFTFTLTPDVPSADGTPPQVQTNRPTPNVPNASGIRITPNADDSYTVVIIGIRQDIEITLAVAGSKSDPTNNESVAAGLNIYTAPGAIIVTNSRPDAALVRVYSLAGTLVRLTTVPPGTTRLAVPSGIYIVTDGGAFRRKTAVFR